MQRCVTASFSSMVRFRFIAVKKCFHFVAVFPAKCIVFTFQMSVGQKIAALYVVTFLLILPTLFHDVPHSVFYLSQKKSVLNEQMRNANSERIEQAEKYFSLLNSSGAFQHVTSRSVNSDRAITVALTIITVSRNRHQIDNYEPKYLTQTVWKFHLLLEKWRSYSRQVRIEMSICNVDSRVNSYHEAHALSQFVPMFFRFNDTHFSVVHTLEKEKQDYVFCLNRSLQLNEEADYVFLVEDDALPTDDVFHVVNDVLLRHTEQSFVRGEFHSKPSDVAFVKFYHPERLLNFVSLERERLSELFSYAALMSSLLTAVYIVTCGAEVSVNACWGKLFLFSLIVMLACGRSGISEWRRWASPTFYSYTQAPSCCTPALLFPRTAAVLTVNYLRNVSCHTNFGKDSALDKMLHDTQMKAYLVQPNTFTHIGVYSSLRLRMVDPFLV